MRAIFCYNYSKFFISHRLPLINKIKHNFTNTVFLGNILKDESLIISKNMNLSFDTNITKGSINIFKIIKYFFLFPHKQLRERNQFDLIEIATLKGLLIALPIILRNKDAKIVIWICGLGTIFLSHSIHHKVIRYFFYKIYSHIYTSFNTSWIFENQDDKIFFQKKLELKQDDITVIPGSGYELKKTRHKSHQGVKNKIVFIGRLIKDKGIIEFIEAAKIILSSPEYRSWSFEIIGDFDDNPTSINKPQLDYLIGSSSINFKGFVSEMTEYYDEIYCVVLPSYREGLSRVLIEAGAHSIPSVTTNVTGCKDIIKNRINGMLVNPKDINNLSDAIKYLIDNPEHSMEMGINAYKIFNKNYSLEIISEKTLNFYKYI